MEENSPYHASAMAPVVARAWDPVPHTISGPIKQMWMLLAGIGVLIIVLTGVGAVWAYRTPDGSMLASSVVLVFGAFIAAMYGGLAFGIYKRSRVVACLVLALCALLLLGAIFVGETVSLGRLGFWVVAIFISVRGTHAIFRHHRFIAEEKRRPPRTRISDDPAFAPKLRALD